MMDQENKKQKPKDTSESYSQESLQDFIDKRRLQNKVLREILEKLYQLPNDRNTDPAHAEKPDTPDLLP